MGTGGNRESVLNRDTVSVLHGKEGSGEDGVGGRTARGRPQSYLLNCARKNGYDGKCYVIRVSCRN